MSKPNKNRIPVDGTATKDEILNDAFAGLSTENLPQMQAEEKRSRNAKPDKPIAHGRVNLAVEKSGRSGKIVTILSGDGIEKLPREQRDELLASLKRKFACGGCVNADGKLELQGDERERLRFFLQMLGFKI